MEELALFLICVIAILAVSLLGAYAPMSFRATDKQMHLMIAFGSGVFIGILFLILMPEAINESEAGGFDAMDAMYLILAGFLTMFIVDFLFKQYKRSECDCEECADYHSHEITSLSAFVGLSLHSCFDGLAIAAAFLVGETVGFMVLVAMCLHKAVVVFSLSSTFLLAGKRKKAAVYLTVFCLITPVAALISYFVLGGFESDIVGLAFAFSAGVFMFVTMLHIIPEAFHRKDINIKSLALLIVGLLIVVGLVLLMGSEGHIH
ncbi:MAG: ZIP family metal transporter [Candidatus Methanoplasma sp.]|jgi:zinc transporter ZupT|nr:ZIP family metal transporter [Candidatus Methanoplasma sp.]